MNTLTLQATFCGLLHGLGKLAFRADKTAADLLAALPDTPEWAAVRGGAAAGSDAARCAAFARSLSVTADTPAAEPASSRCRPLRSIFSHLNGEHPGYSVPAARPDGALHDPVQDAPDIPAAVYRELYQELTGQLTGLQFSPAQANALLGLLESQCSGLPASTARDEDRDISLYDQLKLTAALAACVSEYLQQGDAFSLLDTPAELRRKPAFLLYTADFSRIQRFIYTVHTEGALRSLRSRSFFLELLMEHYMDELLDGCGLTRTNIIYSGGGHCYLLLPNTAAVQQTLADWNRAFNGWLNEQFGVQLFLANGWTPCSANDLCNVPAEASPYKATPRQIERVVAGSRFGVNIVYNLSDPKEMEEDLSLLSKARKLLQLDYLGGHGAPLQMEPLGSHSVENSLQLLLAAREDPASRTRLWFRTPCAFKQAGRYAIYPQEFLLLQSLVLHWNTAFPDCQLNDPDALDAILRGLHILDYNLHTVSYPIKNTRIPGFVGSAVVEARLALPLLELWNALLSFAPYGGIGIKTTLGMGGVSVEPLVQPQRSL